MTGSLRQLALREDGSIFVVGAIVMVVFAMLGAGMLEVGKWFHDRRNLQARTDAAALAAGQALNACFNIGNVQFPTESDADTYIESWAKNYGGFNSAATGQTGSPYNKQVDGGTTYMSFQSDNDPSAATPTPTKNLGPECFLDGNPTNTATSNVNLMTDVKTTQSGLPPWFSFSPAATTHGWARVQLQTVKSLKPSLPLAIPDVNPAHVSVTFVDNSTGAALTGCSTPGCVFPLSGPTSVGTLNNWSGPATIQMPAADANVGIRIGIGSQNGTCAGVNATATYTCYDYSTKGQPQPNGLVVIRSYSTAAQSGATPILRAVTPSTCLPVNLPGGSPYFSAYQSAAGSCGNVALNADVDFPTGATNKRVTYGITTQKTCNANQPMTFQSGITWASSSFSSLATGLGANNVCVSWSYTPSGGGGNQSGDFLNKGTVQQIFSGSDGSDATLPGGPIMAVAVTDPSTGLPAYSLPAGQTKTVQVTVSLTGGVHVNPKCSNANGNSGPNYTCATDPTVILRTASTSGSLNYAIDCGEVPGHTGGDLFQEILYGCANSFSINSADVCPDPAAPTPTSCAPVLTGDKTGQVSAAMNARLDPTGGACAPNSYPNTSVSGDPRIFRLVDTDFSAYTGSGGSSSSDVPVVTFATFYVTGWNNADANCAPLNEPTPPGAVTQGKSSNIWGHFIDYSTGDGTPSGITCKLNTPTPCVVALVR